MKRVAACILLAALAAGSGCSIRQLAVRQLGSALAQGGGAFAQEEDVRLAGEAIPFSLKLIESLLLQDPGNTDLLTAAAAGFTQYAYGWVHQPADFAEDADPAAAAAERERAARLYLRANRYATEALEKLLPGFSTDRSAALASANASHVPLLYWHAASLGAALSVSKQNASLLARIPEVASSIDAAHRLDTDWNLGALHAFQIAFEPARTDRTTPTKQRVEAAFSEAMRASGGLSAAPLVTLAETLCVQEQDGERFSLLLQQALAIDLDQAPDLRLANRIAQERARWLLERKDDLILE